MSCLEVRVTNNQLQKFESGEYVEAKFANKHGYSEALFELTEASFEKYTAMRASGELKQRDRLIKLRGVHGEKIAVFHNNPYYNFLSEEDRKELLKADFIICCYSVFLEPVLRNKVAVLSLFDTKTVVEKVNGKNMLCVYTAMQGKLPAGMFDKCNTLVGAEILEEIENISRTRCS
jgi:hypothetical protein